MRITINNISDVYRAKEASIETMELKGYELIENLFVDSSGFGMPGELALTNSQFTMQLEALLAEHGQLTAKITGVGQFQVYVGLFKKTGKSKVKRISTNVLELTEGDATIIRLYDTDIVKLQGKTMQLFTGGHQTETTSKWINKYLPNDMYLYQKKWQWYIHNNRTDETIEFHEGIEIAI